MILGIDKVFIVEIRPGNIPRIVSKLDTMQVLNTRCEEGLRPTDCDLQPPAELQIVDAVSSSLAWAFTLNKETSKSYRVPHFSNLVYSKAIREQNGISNRT
jgi:hypothetical protein